MKKVNTLTSWDDHFPCSRELIFDLVIKLSGELDVNHSLGLRVKHIYLTLELPLVTKTGKTLVRCGCENKYKEVRVKITLQNY